LLADALCADFLEGDDFHPPANLEKLRGGEPLDDAERAPWLQNIAVALDAGGRDDPVVLACSVLKQAYRDHLTAGRADVHLVYLRGDAALIGRRLEARGGHFMPAALLASQLAALEQPVDAITVDAALAPHAIVDRVLAVLTGGG
jgi:gluconokinase